MKNLFSPNHQRVLAACFCLLGVALLYAPLAGAAWSAHALACCTGDHCPIPQHHHRKAAPHEDCEHELGMSACSMSCCQDQEQAAMTALVFVIPDGNFVAASLLIIPAANSRNLSEIPRSSKPLSPPPRVTTAIA